MTRYSRSSTGLRAARPGPGNLDPREVQGIALHWPAMGKRRLDAADEVQAALRGWQDYHMDTHGWSDIAYQEAIDQAGNVYVLRGLRTQSGANGDTAVNKAYGALLLVLGEGETPTPAMLVAVRRRIRRFRELYPRATRIRGHNDVRPEPTACPGPIVSKLIASRAFDPFHLDTDGRR